MFTIVAISVILLIGIIFWTEKISLTNDSLLLLEERLTKLEKDAVKITFQSKPNPNRYSLQRRIALVSLKCPPSD